MNQIIADLKPTEDPDKLIEVIKKIFPNAKLKIEKDKIIGETDLEHFNELLRKQKIQTTIGDIIQKGHIDLSKLAAEAGKIAVDEGFPLGKIKLIVKQEA